MTYREYAWRTLDKAKIGRFTIRTSRNTEVPAIKYGPDEFKLASFSTHLTGADVIRFLQLPQEVQLMLGSMLPTGSIGELLAYLKPIYGEALNGR